ncbi:MAG TPA: ATP-binding protein [Candidatus Aminicenantes bacterium]|nr:ATP-binding protein [Candidatus Aminicenantes bacterium]
MEDLSLHLLDVAENSLAAQATRVIITLEINTANKTLRLIIEDNGQGMDKQTLKKAVDPFFTTKKTRRIGLGLSLLAQAAHATGGQFSIESKPGQGTKVSTLFYTDHWDFKPLGDIPQTLLTLVLGHPEVELIFIYRRDDKETIFSTKEVKAKLNGLPLNSPAAIPLIMNHINKAMNL